MRSYRALLLRQFPENPTLGFYRHPKLPSSLVGRSLGRFLHVTSPADVVAFYHHDRLFRSHEVMFTDTHFYDRQAYFPLEDVRAAQQKGSNVVVGLQQVGKLISHTMELGQSMAAELMVRVFEMIIQAPKDDLLERTRELRAGLNPQSIQWLELRDEVLRTIDLLHEKYQEGKLSLLEYETLKEDLLRHLT